MFTFTADINFDYLDQLKQERVIEMRVPSFSRPQFAINSGTTSKTIIIPVNDNDLADVFKETRDNISLQDISEVTIMVLGHAGLERLNKFREYRDGWDLGKGRELSQKSLSTMEYFVNQFYSFHVTPSVFMSNEGNLLLGWEDTAGKRIELEFYPNAIGYYIETLDEEEEIVLDTTQIEILVQKLHQI